MWKIFSILAISFVSQSSQLVEQDPQKMANSAPIIIVARVSKVTLTRDDGINGRDYSVALATLSHIKGSTRAREIIVRTSQGGASGFSLSYKAGDIGVFFFDKVEKGQGWLLHDGAVAFFDKSYFIK